MNKYINSEKLIAEIEKRAKFHDDAMKACVGLNNIAITHSAGWKEDAEFLAIITSLQQEQPLTTEKVVEQCKKFGGNPEVIQPEVDFEKEYKSYIESRKDDLSGNAITVNMKDLARYFYELGLNERKEK